jgi:hypothetical protein
MLQFVSESVQPITRASRLPVVTSGLHPRSPARQRPPQRGHGIGPSAYSIGESLVANALSIQACRRAFKAPTTDAASAHPCLPIFFPRRQPRQQARRPPSYTAPHVRERSCRQQAFGACAGGVAVSVAVGGKPAPGRSTPPSVETILSSAAFPVPPPRLRRHSNPRR